MEEDKNYNGFQLDRYSFAEVFHIEKGNIVTFTGGGGKTSLIFKLAEELKKKGKVCITTTTKMDIPNSSDYDRLIIKNKIAGDKEFYKGSQSNIDFYAMEIDYNKNKIMGDLNSIDFEGLKKKYDYILVEADGSRGRSMKCWNEDEPCIPIEADRVIGVFNINSLGIKVEEGFLRADRFSETEKMQVIDERLAGEYLAKKRFFRIFEKDEIGKKNQKNNRKYYTYINGVENLTAFNSALEIGNILSKSSGEISEEIVLGSVFNGEIYPYESFEAIIMASGNSKRLGKNKLILRHYNKTLLEVTAERVGTINFSEKKLVISPENLEAYIESLSIVEELKVLNWEERRKIGKDLLLNKLGEYSEILINKNSVEGQSSSIKIGLESKKILKCDSTIENKAIPNNRRNYIFIPCDQPFIKKESILLLIKEHILAKNSRITLPWIEERGNSPVIFSEELRDNLLALYGDRGGREIIREFKNVHRVKFEDIKEFWDIDTAEDEKLLVKNEI